MHQGCIGVWKNWVCRSINMQITLRERRNDLPMTVAVSAASGKAQADVSGMRACTQSVASNSENPSVTSVSLNLPARCAELHVSQPEELESPMDVLNACMDRQSAANDSQRPRNKMECTGTSQIGTSKLGVLDTVVYAGGVNGLVGTSGHDG